jgi:hypothetical protein
MAAIAVGVAFGGIAMVAGPASAGKPTITATGNVSCSGLNGKVKINPPLTNANTQPSTITAKIKATCTGSTETGVTPSAAKGSVLSVGTSPGTCSGLTQPGTTPFGVDLKWKGTGGKINPSHVTFPNVTPAGIGFDLNNGDTSGSYAGNDNADAHANIDIPDFAACDPGPPPKNKPAKGIKKLTITSGTLTIT